MLGIALQDGSPVLPGFVITAPLFIQFLETVDWPDPLFADFPHSSFHLDIDNPIQLRSIAQCLQAGIMAQPLADHYQEAIWQAVQALKVGKVEIQPSIGFRDLPRLKTKNPRYTSQFLSTLITHAQPLLTSLICFTERDSVIQSLHQMWSQFLGANHLFYWQRLGISLQHLQVGLLIRPVTSAIISGKTRLCADGAYMDAVWGNVSALANGDVTPDQYKYQNGELIEQHSSIKRYVYILPCPPPTKNPLTTDDMGQGLQIQDLSRGFPEAEIPQLSANLQAERLRTERYLMHPSLASQSVLSEDSGLALLKTMQGLSERANPILGSSEEVWIEWSLYPRWLASAHWGAAQYEILLTWLRGRSDLNSDALLSDDQYVVYINQILASSEFHSGKLPETPREKTVSAVDIAINDYQNHQGQQRLPEKGEGKPLGRQYSNAMVSSPSFLNPGSLEPPTQEDSDQGTGNSPLDLEAINWGEKLSGLGTSSGQVLGQIWVMPDTWANSSEITHAIPKGYILLAQDLSPVWLNAMQGIQGVLSSQGSMTCHAAIVARELGIPSVMGLPEVVSCLKTGDWVWIDGDRGTVTLIPEASVAALTQALRQQQSNGSTASALPPLSPPMSSTGVEPDDGQTHERLGVRSPLYASADDTKRVQTATQLMMNLSLNQADNLSSIAAQASDGIGLIRSEIMLAALLHHQSIPDWLKAAHRGLLVKTIQHHIKQFAHAFSPRPIWYRTLDMHRHDVAAGSSAHRRDMNPLLGCHGAMSYQQSPGFFLAELEAIRKLQLEGLRNINLILPFVRTVEEFQFCYRMMAQAQILVDGACEVWIMAEVPSILFLLPDYVAAGVQGIAIGTNDLTQLLLATDRMNPAMNMSRETPHPAVLRAIEQLITQAKQAQIPCSLCGELVSQHPTIIEALIRWGVTALSVSPDALARTHHEILRAEKRLFLEWGRD